MDDIELPDVRTGGDEGEHLVEIYSERIVFSWKSNADVLKALYMLQEHILESDVLIQFQNGSTKGRLS